MRVGDCYQLGYVIRTHGLKGELQIFLDVDDPKQYQNLESMFVLRNGALIPFSLAYIHINGDKALIKLEALDDIDEAKTFVSAALYLPLSFLPELADDQYYFHELIGYELLDGGRVIGMVKNVFSMAAQDLIEVDCEGIEVLVPVHDQVVKKIDKGNRKVYTDLPSGLLDVYLE